MLRMFKQFSITNKANEVATNYLVLVVTIPSYGLLAKASYLKLGTNYTYTTLGFIQICALVFRDLLSLGWINLQNICSHYQEEVLRIPKLHQLVKFG